jgi:hypothetical protein
MFVVDKISEVMEYHKKYYEKVWEVGDTDRQHCKFNYTSLNI